MARVLGASTAGYYAWLKQVPSANGEANPTLLQRIRTVNTTSRAIAAGYEDGNDADRLCHNAWRR